MLHVWLRRRKWKLLFDVYHFGAVERKIASEGLTSVVVRLKFSFVIMLKATVKYHSVYIIIPSTQ